MLKKQGVKYDKEKLRYDLLPPIAIEKVVKVLTHGAKKYSPDNWKDVPEWERRYYAAAMRHVAAWKKGFKKDKQTGQSHLAHAICCLLFMMERERIGK